MVEIKRGNEEVKWKNEEEILVLRKENEEMKKKLVEGFRLADWVIQLGSPLPPPPTLELLRSRKQSTPRRPRVSPI